MARRQTYTIEQIEMALRNTGGLRTQAADQLGCVVTTVSNYVNRSKYLQRVEAEIIDRNLDFCETQLIKNAKEGKEPSLFKYLDAKGMGRGYGRQVIQNVGPDGGPLQAVVKILTPRSIKDMSDEELEDFIRGECGSQPG
jgi:hypothetical protein